MKGTLWITGVAGFSGRHVAEMAARLPDRPRTVGIDVVESPVLPLDAYYRLDLCETSEVAAAARRDPPTWIIHLAGLAPTSLREDLWRVNVGGTLGLALGIVSAECRRARVLGIGSAAEYQPAHGKALTERSRVGPSTDYGRAKLAQTQLTLGFCRTLGLRACVARTFNLVGPGLPTRFVLGRLCDEFARAGRRGTITLQHLETSRDFVDIRDAAEAYWLLVRRGRAGEVYNVCSGSAVGVRRLVELLSIATAKQPTVRTTQPRDPTSDPDVVFGSFAKIRRAMGWAPRIDLRASIDAMLDQHRGRTTEGAVRDASTLAAKS